MSDTETFERIRGLAFGCCGTVDDKQVREWVGQSMNGEITHGDLAVLAWCHGVEPERCHAARRTIRLHRTVGFAVMAAVLTVILVVIGVRMNLI